MADTYKVLAQSNPAATTLTAVYTVPASTSAIVSSITICNQSTAAASYRIGIAVAGAAGTTKQYLVYDSPIRGNDTHNFQLGVTLAATDVVRVYCSTANFSVNVFGVEKT